MFDKVLIANRGEIACRIMRTMKRMGVKSVAVYSEADAGARHVLEADEAVCIGPAPAAESYLNAERILQVARQTGAQAIHPGYGFLSENQSFATACETAGIAFIGPTPAQMRDFGLKHSARELAEANGVPLLPGTGLLADAVEAQAEAARIGYPVMLKSTAGGGGIGMRLIWSADELAEAFESVQRLSKANFKDGGIYLEKYVQAARHIEVQIFGDGKGKVIALGERDCSVQRRNQKVIEETPAPNISESVRIRLSETASRLASAISYRSAGTVEFVYDNDSGEFYFLEVNTRLQVEHGVTELVSGIDLVEWMIRLAAGEPLPDYVHQPQGHAIQVRVYAEDANKNFQPSSGTLTEAGFPSDVRVDTWVARGSEVSPFYDPLVAKVLVHAENRDAAVAKMRKALAETRLAGIETNLEYLRQVLADRVFPAGEQVTRYLNSFHYRPTTLDVLEPGVQSTVQDYPGRLGYWAVGVPPSGPMDHLAFRFANRLAGNDEGTAALELTLIGPTLKFNCDAVIALAGAPMQAELDGQAIALWQAQAVKAGSVLRLGSIQGAGCRVYLAVRGGFDVPDYLGSKSTFTLGQFGGHGGRTLRVGDVLHLTAPSPSFDKLVVSIAERLRTGQASPARGEGARLAGELIPGYSHAWEIGVLYGPHGAPDFFTDADIEMFFSTDWEVHYNSNRTGVRLIGPKPEWARTDGGEAGLHPSNIHDNAYAIGTVDFTGDMPVILGPDGPSLGGFVCPATIVQAELWKMGQLKPGDTVRFKRLSQAEARTLEEAQDKVIETLQPSTKSARMVAVETSPLLDRIPASNTQIAIAYRQSGDKNLLVEYGPLALDLNLRFRVHALMQWLEKQAIPGIIDLTPGIRSLQVHYDNRKLPVERLLDLLMQTERELPAIEDMEVPTRIVHLPLSWDDAATQLAIEKYMQSVRKDAPWCPSNIEFIRRINGLNSIEEVKKIVFEASYLTLGLGDVYLGAPVAMPVDPRHRLVTTKYNPARTWTPENAVGIGGAYMCVYGMEGPGGYQFVGRTVQMWNRWNQTADFRDGKPWLLRFFDQIRFYPVSAEELLQMREDFPRGKFKLKVEEQTFSLREYNRFLADNASSIAAFKATQQASFDAERERWIATGQAHYSSDHDVAEASTDSELDLPPNSRAVASHVAGNLWQIKVQPGDAVKQGDAVVIVESMKMEITVAAPCNGTVIHVFCQEGGQVAAGQDLFVIQQEVSIPNLEIAALRRQYQAGELTPTQLMEALDARIGHDEPHNIWIRRLTREEMLAYAKRLEGQSPVDLPLYGIPFAIKDNIDLAGIPTTAACPGYAYTPEKSATVVQRLIDAGAIPVGKTNLDQFATGLVGARSPYGPGRNAFDPEYISGGSSSGSAVSVALGLASFGLGTDTAGSGRVPAAFNNLVGLKPSCGVLSTAGVVPACRTLDCVSIFAKTPADADAVFAVAQRFDAEDAYSRPVESAPAPLGPGFRFGVPKREQLEFFGNLDTPALFEAAVKKLQVLGGEQVEIDFAPFLDTARLLYEGPWVAERYAAIREFIESKPDALFPVTRQIISSATRFSAADTFASLYKLKAMQRKTAPVWNDMDVLLTPTAGTIYTIAEVEADPVRTNSNLGYYTNFMNLLDLCAVAVPAGFQRNGLPFGVTLAAPAFSDAMLLALAGRWMK